MKKKAVSILLTVTMAAAMLSGCGNNAGSASGDASASSDGAATESGKAATEDFSNIKVGAIGSFGKDDGGWTQAQYTGIVNAFSLVIGFLEAGIAPKIRFTSFSYSVGSISPIMATYCNSGRYHCW